MPTRYIPTFWHAPFTSHPLTLTVPFGIADQWHKSHSQRLVVLRYFVLCSTLHWFSLWTVKTLSFGKHLGHLLEIRQKIYLVRIRKYSWVRVVCVTLHSTLHLHPTWHILPFESTFSFSTWRKTKIDWLKYFQSFNQSIFVSFLGLINPWCCSFGI